ncbi:uncharacterized protein BP5553_07403 [Venustampulla echinocandica]|uniref:Ecp2 effector protein domain-containing protein n=1 Tax=Venustampulla echinocandica TaxID=2656787 RepID=A0A370TJF6_9HELO|nr:uncharacterized protein BP5553_07403 [Venustampulla echinocandica]RDL35472.1 hypothetical protein BP5553_07403 [Venustampulla echinocandica]
MTRIINLALLILQVLLGLFAIALAAPVVEATLVEVIPGPGMPSLASLNLTSAQLYAMDPLSHGLDARGANIEEKCFNFDLAPRTQVSACKSYLTALGKTMCGVHAPAGVHGFYQAFCQAGKAMIYGANWGPTDFAGSYCSDVALAIGYLLRDCGANGGDIAGQIAANGNGALLVSVVGV